MVIKKKKQTTVRVKVTKHMNRGYDHTDYKNAVDLKDYKALANFFEDIRVLFDAPVEKAYREMKKKRNPFW